MPIIRGQVDPESASSPVIPEKHGQAIRAEAIAYFSDQVHIWWGPRQTYHLHLVVIKQDHQRVMVDPMLLIILIYELF